METRGQMGKAGDNGHTMNLIMIIQGFILAHLFNMMNSKVTNTVGYTYIGNSIYTKLELAEAMSVECCIVMSNTAPVKEFINTMKVF